MSQAAVLNKSAFGASGIPLVDLSTCLSPHNGTGGRFSEQGSYQMAAGWVVVNFFKHLLFLASNTRSEYFIVFVITRLIAL